MYNVSDAYKTAIRSNSAIQHIRGTIKTASELEIPITDIIVGDISKSMQCINDNSVFGIGGVFQGQLKFSLKAGSITKRTIYGSKVMIDFGVELPEGTIEWVPLGVFYISEALRDENQINCTAYDRMSDLDVDMLAMAEKYNYNRGLCPYQDATVYSLVVLATGIEFEQTLNEIRGMTKVPLWAMYGANPPKTLRGAIREIAELIGGFAFINRSGKIEFRRFDDTVPVSIIPAEKRSSIKLSERQFSISRVSYTTYDGLYFESAGSVKSGYTLHFENNGLMYNQTKTGAYEKSICGYILENLSEVEFTPGTVEYSGDPALDVGDYITISGGVGGADTVMLICADEWQFRAPQSISAAGHDDTSQTSSGNGSIGIGQAAADTSDTSALMRQLTINAIPCDVSIGAVYTDGKTVASSDFNCIVSGCNCFFQCDVAVSSSIAENVTAEFYIDNTLQEFSPKITVNSGYQLQHYSFTAYGLGVGEHNVSLNLKGENSVVSLVNSGIFGQGLQEISTEPTASSDYLYRTDSDGVHIYGYIGSIIRPEIPDTIDSKPVVTIESTAFNYNNKIKAVVIPEGVTTVY